jgi:hypothetical protein
MRLRSTNCTNVSLFEFTSVGALEEDIVADWRKQNLSTFRIAELAKDGLERQGLLLLFQWCIANTAAHGQGP